MKRNWWNSLSMCRREVARRSKENRAEIVRKLAAQGMNSSQIARETGFSSGSVYYYMHPEKYKKQEIPLDYKNPDAYPG